MRNKNDPGKENRTFETRLEFIADIFSNPYTKLEILASCVQFKLNQSYEAYLVAVKRSLEILKLKDSTKVITKIK